MRLFTAIEIPSDIKQRLRGFIDRLRPSARLSWSPVDNLHVTTKFIGEWPEATLNALKISLAAVPTSGTITIRVHSVGWFPNPKNPRVFWAGIEGNEALNRLAADTEEATVALGAPREERGFHPHLTLARRRDTAPVDKLRQILEALSLDSTEFGTFSASSFFLYLSAGGKYTKLQEFPLAAP